MTRSMIATAFTLVALVVTGCGASPTAGVPYKSTIRSNTSTTAKAATGTSAQVGALTLQLSTLKAGALDLKLSGAGLSAPLSRRLTATELSTTNKVAFENLPVGSYTVAMTAFDASNKALGTKSTTFQVVASAPTELGLQLAIANGALNFSTVDINAITSSNLEASTKPATETADDSDADDSTDPETVVEGDENGALGIEVVGKETVRKFLLFKKLAVTVKVTNHNATETLSGTVKVDFYTTSGIFTKTPKLAQTLVQDIQNLAPGKSVELTIQSTKSAVDAEATVSTVVAAETASTAE